MVYYLIEKHMQKFRKKMSLTSLLHKAIQLLSLFPILARYMCKSSIKYCTILKMSLLIHLGVWVLRHNTVWKLSSLIINRTRLIPLLWSLICPWSWVHLIYIEHIMSLINSLTLELSSLQSRRISTLESNIHERVQSARKESLRVCPREDQAEVTHATSLISLKLSQMIKVIKLFKNPK